MTTDASSGGSGTGQPAVASVPDVVTRVREQLPAHLDQLLDVAADIHAHPEIRFTETHAATRLTAELERAGFDVQRGFAGLETAFVGRWSTPDANDDAPTVAIFCEYDALEDIGHACGHNIIAAAGLGAGLLVKDVLSAGSDPAHLVVVGSPGEEGAAGKVPMIEGGVLDGVDFAMMVHPAGSDAVRASSLSRVALDISFSGRAAHAAADPHLGRNALDAATLSLTAIGLLRQQLTDDVRVHAIITNGGQAPNIIPERAELRTFVRASDRDRLLNDVVPRVKACFEGAAICTGTTVEIAENTPAYMAMVSNPVLSDIAEAAFSALDRELDPEPTLGGSTDMGNVSHVVPSIHPLICLAPGLTLHTWEFATAAGDRAQAEPAIADGAVMLAATAVAALTDAEAMAALRADA